ncbi:MAG: ACT domain-containing protein [Spirochaetales bacterium]|nr:ACT domain-containing protein [Spirochaetales bacterium]MDD6840678.1 ACT domain-containing protein [Spirochaetales bacterium]
MAKSKSIITVVGKDQVGIIARVTGYLYENNVNVEDITQSIVAGFFNMMMIVDTGASTKEFLTLSKELEELGSKIGVMIKLQREDIFESMQRI